MLLIHPPVVKPCEPPLGIACLSGVLKAHNLPHEVFDANLERIGHSLRHPPASAAFERDTWTKRAWKNHSAHLDALRNLSVYSSLPRYKRAVLDLDRVLAKMGEPLPVRVGLANYQHRQLSPTRSADLFRTAEEPEKDPFHAFYQTRLLQRMEKVRTEEVGLSLNFLTQAIPAFALMGFLKKKFPKVRIFLGGGLVTSWVRGTGRKNLFSGIVDELIAGPGEAPLLAALGLREEIQISSTVDFDCLPIHQYFAPGFILPYSTTRGCYWGRCLFCPERAEGNVYTSTPTERVVSDLFGLVEKHKPVLVHLTDNALPPRLMEGIIKNPFGAPWYGFARITPHLADLDFCLALRGSGCTMLQIGVESGDQDVLDRLQKGINLDLVSKALKNLHRAGIAAYVYLLFGTPQETPSEARRTLEFVVRHSEDIAFLNLALFNLPLHGEGVSNLQTKKLSEGDLSLYTGFIHPGGWNRSEVRQFLDKEFKRHPAVAGILRRDPPVFTSNHAPFFEMDRRGKF